MSIGFVRVVTGGYAMWRLNLPVRLYRVLAVLDVLGTLGIVVPVARSSI